MQIIFYITIYITGILLGSFFTLATYRLPLKQDITHTRSYCPNCNHRLNFWDLIPVLSFTFLKGKCRYCKNKISPRYVIIELTSGLIYLLFVMSLKLNLYTLNLVNIFQLCLFTILFSVLFILGGITKENKKIPASVIITGVISLVIYIIYLYIFKLDIHRYIIYLSLIITIIISLIIKILNIKKLNLAFIQSFSLIMILIINNLYFI